MLVNGILMKCLQTKTEHRDGVKRPDVIVQTVQQHLDGNFNAKSGKTAPELMAFRFFKNIF